MRVSKSGHPTHFIIMRDGPVKLGNGRRLNQVAFFQVRPQNFFQARF